MTITCGPIYPFGRVQNPDGTWTIGNSAQCQVPDPAIWAHTYTFLFPSVLTYLDGVTMQFVGSAQAYVQGHHDRVGRSAVRLVMVNAATLTDPSGAILPVAKTEIYPQGPQWPVDQWSSTGALAPDTLYSLAVSGTDPGINPSTDTLIIRAVYQQVQTQSGGGDD